MYYYALAVCQRHTMLSCTFIKVVSYVQLSFHNFHMWRYVLSPWIVTPVSHMTQKRGGRRAADLFYDIWWELEWDTEMCGSCCGIPHVHFSPILRNDFISTTLTIMWRSTVYTGHPLMMLWVLHDSILTCQSLSVVIKIYDKQYPNCFFFWTVRNFHWLVWI